MAGIKAGTIKIHHPHFARNPKNDRFCTIDLSRPAVLAIDWWTKDPAAICAGWPKHLAAATGEKPAHPILDDYRHHFTLTINGEAHSVLEPGLESSLADRLSSLDWIVAKCRELGQDPDKSIMVHVDPICVFETGSSSDARDNLDHLPALCDRMRALKLTRMHISFMQFSWQSVRSRLKAMAETLRIRALTDTEQVALFESRVRPHIAGIQVQTCTATALIVKYREEGTVIKGACFGWEDVVAVVGDKDLVGPPRVNKAKNAASRLCGCFPFKDAGCARDPCKHGCPYCFMHPAAPPHPPPPDW
jgi:hypothetical protein